MAQKRLRTADLTIQTPHPYPHRTVGSKFQVFLNFVVVFNSELETQYGVQVFRTAKVHYLIIIFSICHFKTAPLLREKCHISWIKQH